MDWYPYDTVIYSRQHASDMVACEIFKIDDSILQYIFHRMHEVVDSYNDRINDDGTYTPKSYNPHLQARIAAVRNTVHLFC